MLHASRVLHQCRPPIIGFDRLIDSKIFLSNIGTEMLDFHTKKCKLIVLAMVLENRNWACLMAESMVDTVLKLYLFSFGHGICMVYFVYSLSNVIVAEVK